MRRAFSERVERGRARSGYAASQPGDDFGFFHLRTNAGQQLGVMVSSGTERVPWEHVSVSHKHRCPTWEEMCWVKSLFFDDEEAVVQFHPPKSEYVNQHPYCLHLWRPTSVEMPRPPRAAVGIPDDLNDEDAALLASGGFVVVRLPEGA